MQDGAKREEFQRQSALQAQKGTKKKAPALFRMRLPEFCIRKS